MIRILRIMIFILCSCASFAGVQSLTNIKSLKVEIQETTYVNNKTKKSEYNLEFVKPDKFRKDVISPEMNKGEIYIYVGNEKTVYLPFFDQVTKETTDSEENDIISAINYILNIENRDPEFSQKYYTKKLKYLKLDNGSKIEISNLKTVDNYLLPFTFDIYEGDSKMATLKIKKYSINPSISDEEFKLK